MSEITVNKIKILSGTQLQISGQVAGVAATQQDQFVTLAQISTTTEGGVTQQYVNAEVGNALQIAKTHSDNNDTEQTDTLTELMVSKDTTILTAAKVYADSLVTTPTQPATYVVTEKDTPITNGVVYDLGDGPFAINGSFAGAGNTQDSNTNQDSYVDYTFYTDAAGTEGASVTRRIGGLLYNGTVIAAWIPFTIFIPTLGEGAYESIKFTFTGIISNFVVHTEVNLVQPV